MLSKLFEALTGTRKRVITVIPSVELTEMREVSKDLYLVKLNTKSAIAQYHFEYVSSVDAERLALEADKVIQESTEIFKRSERSQRLESEFNRLHVLEEEFVTKLLATHGIEFTDEIELDSETGEVSIEEDISKD